MSGKTTHTLRMAKATHEDVDSAMKIASLVEGLHKDQHPGEADFFDADDSEHLRALYDHVIAATAGAGGGLFRVALGMHSILASNILDPDDDCLALHPRLQPVVWEASTAEIDLALKLVDCPDALAAELRNAARILRAETLLRWQQRTALSFRLQALQRALVAANIDDQSELYQALHDATATAEAWMHPGTLDEATAAHIHALSVVLFGPPTETMRIAGFECAAFDELMDAATEQKGWPYSCKEAADLCAAIFQAMAVASVTLRRVEANADEQSEIVSAGEVACD
ncbi:MAG: hypothetical protein ACREP4_01180 [Stenotrophomonas sp.]|uniref:hypothetical protein n=1 Tax=Stenotrophomonas sp. TaxID=69392 RepID=UPI003D6D9B70